MADVIKTEIYRRTTRTNGVVVREPVMMDMKMDQKDNGSGKNQCFITMDTGSDIVVATEP